MLFLSIFKADFPLGRCLLLKVYFNRNQPYEGELKAPVSIVNSNHNFMDIDLF